MHAHKPVQRGRVQIFAGIVGAHAADAAREALVRVQHPLHQPLIEGIGHAGGGAHKHMVAVRGQARVADLLLVVGEIADWPALLAHIVHAHVSVPRAAGQAVGVHETDIGVPHRHLQLQKVVGHILRPEHALARLQIPHFQLVLALLAAARHQMPVLAALPHVIHVVAGAQMGSWLAGAHLNLPVGQAGDQFAVEFADADHWAGVQRVRAGDAAAGRVVLLHHRLDATDQNLRVVGAKVERRYSAGFRQVGDGLEVGLLVRIVVGQVDVCACGGLKGAENWIKIGWNGFKLGSNGLKWVKMCQNWWKCVTSAPLRWTKSPVWYDRNCYCGCAHEFPLTFKWPSVCADV